MDLLCTSGCPAFAYAFRFWLPILSGAGLQVDLVIAVFGLHKCILLYLEVLGAGDVFYITWRACCIHHLPSVCITAQAYTYIRLNGGSTPKGLQGSVCITAQAYTDIRPGGGSTL